MKKIIAAFDGLKYSESTMRYAVQLARQTTAYLVGVFLDDTSYTSYNPVNLIYERSGLIGSAKRKWDKKDSKVRATAASRFEKACQEADIAYAIHHDRHTALKDLLHETVYADLVIINNSENFKRSSSHSPTPFVKQLLSQARCPVLAVPSEYISINKVVMLYDGEPPSVHAIKMFSYLFHTLKVSAVEIICVKKKDQRVTDPDLALLKEFMKSHFPTIKNITLQGDPVEQIVNYLRAQQDLPIVVLGSNNHGRLSRWFYEGIVDTLMKELYFPLFIVPNN
jgi:nucleotide-binding universal stress UspA family protein